MDSVPDHSTFSRNRHGRFRESDLLGHIFETVVARCITEGLVSGQRLGADGITPMVNHNIGADTRLENRLFDFEIIGHFRMPG